VKLGITLICWEHTAIHDVANAIAPGSETEIPQHWPGHRFDVVWCFTWDENSGAYVFEQFPQRLLAGDVDKPIPLKQKPPSPATAS
jgi:hypothetical protein